ncbi:SpaA isopeptide-forming pilin-related protein [Gemmiger sp.]|uniref:SpaA isopeptide-forming pilin-related protein n=1 Tax=Gemmiger sp. TaxID=2049027 RepID=UPI0025C565B7|nr:SpaA isopeptide-forming pilin-related protein [Gemmiger sp.]
MPTVTPTATPEPTEQPQMDAEEAEDMDRALGVSTQSNQFTVYFAVPSSWEVTKNSTITFNAQRGNGGGKYDGEIGEQPMSLVPDKITSKGQRIYKIILTNGDQTICPWGGYVWMQFTLDENHKVKVTAPPEENNTASHFVKVEVFNDKYYDGDANSENGDVAWNNANWADALALPDPAAHTAFGGQKMVFENLSDSNLANVTAVFTEQDSSGKTTETETVTIGDVAKDKKQGFEIPTSACSSVQFFAENGSKQLSESYNFYEQGTDENTFLYNASKKYCFTYKVNNQSTWGTPQGKQGKQVIYFDATFSWLSYENEKNETHNGAIGCGMPTNDGKLWCYLTGDGKAPKTKQEMNRLEDTNIWYYEVPEGYTKIRFASWAVENGNAADNGDGTAMMDIPADLSEPCFFADASDDVIYNGGNRGGYWAEKGSLRNAKEGKKLTDDVVDISKEPFTEDPNTKYVTSTLYDYYTDYELNGNNRDRYSRAYYAPGKGNGFAKQRSWVTFRQFDRALSDYYESCKAQFPIYTGHFQPSYSDWGIRFDGISAALNLWGLNSVFKNENRFMAINNSTINENGNNDGEHYDYAYQGLVKSETSTGDATGEPLLKDTKDNTKVAEPHFNKAFLSGTNTKNAKLGDVYDNVAFPFTKRQIFDEDKGVDYWYFDSQDTTLYLKQDSTTEQYFLKSSTQNREQSRNLDSDSASKTIKKNGEDVSSYGYFPFNETATAGWASTYNYGFGTKLQMDFTLTDDGKVETNVEKDGKKEKTSIKFFFSGDDDVWVFIDGQLVLDVGGSHGKVSGLLEFGEKTTDEGKKKNSVTAYVSQVKIGGTSNSDQDGSSVKDVTYNGEKISFSAQGTTLTFDKGQKHTLTMYYMERGMWESNMAVAFNFPDNNELQVQKQVVLKNVDPEFQKCFTDKKIFNFTIKNQATHYGTKDAAKPNPSDTKEVNLDADVSNIAPATPGSEDYIFKKEQNQWPDPEQGSGQNTEQVLHWYARYMDTQSAAREKRRGILTLNKPINIKDNMRFLTFQVYVSQEDGGELSLNNLYLELLDEKNVQKGSLGTTGINGATYGSVEVVTGKWVTVKLDLHKMKEQDNFSGSVTTIRVGDNYNRNIYFRNFTFTPKAVPSTMSGFTTDQKEIPDYKSATTGQLENAENAQYTSNMDTDTQLVDEDGRFVLEDGETVTFSDQFRRGSYISLKEKLNENLYDTTWTVYENGQAVDSMKEGNSVSLLSPTLSLKEQKGRSPNDGRTEKIRPNDVQTGNSYTGNKPSADTIVFRSYKDPDETSSTLTKLKVKYVNTVKTGGLKIQKQAAEGEPLTGTYEFKVTFNDVGGEGLEEKPIERTVTIDMNKGDTGTITGIPVGTRYTIEEVETSDGSTLQSVTVPDGQYAHVIGKTMVEGEIVESNNPNDLEVTAIFTNTKRKLINIEFNKLWEDADGTDLSTKKPPDTIYIQLQRRLKNGTGYTDWEPVNYPTADSPDYVTINRDDYGWKCIFNNLDQYPINGSADNNYIYRIVEGTVENGKFKQAAEDGTITINGNTYVVKAKATPKSETNNAGSSTGNTATVTPDGTITGGSGKIELTNKLQNPKFGLNIIKKDAEKGENNKEVFLKDVEFKLEKLRAEKTTEGKTQYTVDTGYKFSSNNKNYLTGITGTDGEITNNPFKNLEPGRYRLTETKAHPGYNLLSKSIDIEFTQDGKYKIDDGTAKNATGDAASGYTVTLTVLNRKTPELPHTGADAPSLWLLIGMPLAVAGLLIFTFRYNRKGGRRH